jgi:steroid delta-isomerase-like uncharacterized protein
MRKKLLFLAPVIAYAAGGPVADGADPKDLEHVSSNDIEKLMPLFTDNVYYEDVTFGVVNHGRTAHRDFATGTFAAFSDLKFELKSRVVATDGRSGVMEWVRRGQQTKDFPGLPATNKPFEVRGSTIVEFADGKISRNSDYWDLATYMKQVGLMK